MDNIATHNITNLTNIHNLCFKKYFSFVSYRFPGKKKIITQIQASVPSKLRSADEMTGKQGFLFAPFQLSHDSPAWLIKDEFLVHDDADEALNDVYEELRLLEPLTSISDFKPETVGNDTHKGEYTRNVDTIKMHIQQGELSKAVLSRLSLLERNEKKPLSQLYHLLEKTYPDAFVYMVYTPFTGCWVGATPETLFMLKNGTGETVSLAGTKPRQEGKPADWKEKELNEQEIVTGYIRRLLEKYNVKNYSLSGPENFEAGNVIHLATRFNFSSENIRKKLWQFVYDLHPTPSVCGLPKNKAFEIITSLEKHERGFYCGFLGPVDGTNSVELFVNLRCMQIMNGNYHLFTGAGITHDSDAEAEWDETDQKKETLLSVLNQFESEN